MALDSLLVNGGKAEEAGEEADEQTSAMMNRPTSLTWLLRSLPQVRYCSVRF